MQSFKGRFVEIIDIEVDKVHYLAFPEVYRIV